MNRRRCKIDITGIVQGVGFRPFVHNLAQRLALNGSVSNTSEGVRVDLQGSVEAIDEFKRSLVTASPPLAKPTIVSVDNLELDRDVNTFVIRDSSVGQKKKMSVTPDAATCQDCLKELFDPSDRRWKYPFINCTNCGPRYTIINDIPYDRPNTTMRDFVMCDQCRKEYSDPCDRRFHAQPIACADCGPQIQLLDSNGNLLVTDNPLEATIQLLQQGRILALKGLGGFHLAVRADNDAGLKQLRERKYRKAKSFAIMALDVETAGCLANVDATAGRLLKSIERPVVLCPKKYDSDLSELAAPASGYWGIMLPYTPLHYLIMQGDYPALVMTSGNITDEPIESDNVGALEKLGRIADYFLTHNRGIYTACDDSVVKVFLSKSMLVRRARGYVPAPLSFTRRDQMDILAVGAHLKNTITYVKGDKAYVSQHIGDLDSAAVYESFLRTIEKLGALTGSEPQIVVCDLHPALLSTGFAEKYQNVKIIRVQHHHAHIAAVMGEYNLEGPILGLAADGVGYGCDGTVWGGELFCVWRDRFERKGHLQQSSMPGGDQASRQPWRMAVSCLFQTYGFVKGKALAQQIIVGVDQGKIAAVMDMLDKNVNCPTSSSLGRFFDAVSALLGICRENTYDAQAAIELENVADPSVTEHYPVEIAVKDCMTVLMIEPLVEALIGDLQSGVGRSIIAAKVHNFVVAGLAEQAGILAEELDLSTVALAGGVFQNDIILTRLVEALEIKGLTVYYNRKLPVNDGSISFGQAVVADAKANQ